MAIALRLAAASACLVGALATAAEPAPAATPREEAIRVYGLRRGNAGHGIDERVRSLAKALQLDARQQAELRRLLESEHAAIRRAWADPAIPAADRAGATRAILDMTADRIRALLSEEQRKHYPAAKPRREPSPRPDLEYWMKLTQQTRASDPAGVAN